MRPSLQEVLATLRTTALCQLATTPPGEVLADAGIREQVEALIECIVRNQASIVDMWIDIAINGE